ncbi:MAG: hypothetical protein COW00_10890 [Bdellovibrio sp. CG12_big_fil_rev_8_21_14_0_65_39_13]|nr:MAG: hypothetical protein COW78_16245 [Bdellovibrio sp. CG22_combo_CG10-13_8_21_14_all_39_27]PIQ59228.1 MAG: hypothetical protein COW00_10890 [Bdellovibrio sp. CG12_big_fil_rev_8_21_14_0_65_39_13]PIR32239.1 MAG: hypothetical protein COV37_20180 [Bdellovibrio sp. CG11_big_fil_rev_8_21_14_0_20_39_38]
MKALKKILPLAIALSLVSPIFAQDDNVDLNEETVTEQADHGSEMMENAGTEMDHQADKAMEKKEEIKEVKKAKKVAKKEVKKAKKLAKKQVKTAKMKARKEVKKAKHAAKKQMKKS